MSRAARLNFDLCLVAGKQSHALFKIDSASKEHHMFLVGLGLEKKVHIETTLMLGHRRHQSVEKIE